MKLSELNKISDGLKQQRDGLHDQLHALLENKDITVAEREAREETLRAQIRDLNDQIWPMDMERAEIDRMVKGNPRKSAKRYLDEAVTLE